MAQRRTKSGTIRAAAEALAAAGAGYPEPPKSVALRPEDRPFWVAIMGARLANEWAQADLVLAGNLARTLADIEANRSLLLAEGDLIHNERTGITKLNPRHVVIETLSRRTMSLTRLLQLHAAPKMGHGADSGARKAEAMKANEALQAAPDDDLLAKPLRH